DQLSYASVGLLTVAVALSFSCRYGIHLGQLAIVVVLAIMAALRAQAQSRPVLAGLFLGIASIKAHTMVPFLMLFHRRSDWPTLLVLLALGTASVLLTLPVSELPKTWNDMRANLDKLNKTINNYEYRNTSSDEIISLAHLFYRLGVRDRNTIELAQ